MRPSDAKLAKLEADKRETFAAAAFNGELVIPMALIQSLKLAQSGAIRATLADGSDVVLESYQCIVDWFGGDTIVEAIASDGQFPLLGVGLLRQRKLVIDYVDRTLQLD